MMNFHRKIAKKTLRLASRRYYDKGSPSETEGSDMTAILKELNHLELPPSVVRELGLSNDWKSKIDPSFAKKAIKTALKYEKALKELSKH
ncbi:hypothetical protein [Alicyclobacillus acidocaldarius]|uniref:hypothetical protein n=1 Tax=Alicyclobacillus acidocaldarius TaxID=405212 RepID=UPI0005A05B55|nr:hypothetical protein [Alicyclobacillus acidocaldarius]